MFDFKNWLAAFFSAPVQCMSHDIAHAFVSLVLAEQKDIRNPEIEAKMKEDFLFQVLESKCAKVGLEANIFFKCFIAALCEDPAEVTMYIVALRSKMKTATMMELGRTLANGFPSRNTLSHLWGLQKLSDEERKSHGGIIDNGIDFIWEKDYGTNS
jgi:hypothetical protein